MSKRAVAAVVAVVTALGGALGLGVNGQRVAGDVSERVRALEVRQEDHGARLKRIEDGIDTLLERVR